MDGFPRGFISMKWLRPAFLCLISLAAISLSLRVYSVSLLVQTQQSFDLRISDAIQFQNGDKFVIIAVESGVMNGTSATVNVNTSVGHLIFDAVDNATLALRLVSSDAMDVAVSGCTISTLNSTAYRINIVTGNHIQISWRYMLPSFADQYTVLAFGLAGVALMAFSPTWAVWRYRKEGLDTGFIEGIGYSIILFVIGLGLFLTWLTW